MFMSLKQKKFLPFETTWIKLGSIMLSEMSPIKKDKYSSVESKKNLF